jgi:hypothetical protein
VAIHSPEGRERKNVKTWLWKGVLAAVIFLPVLGGAAAEEQQGQEQRGIEGVWDVRITIVQCNTSQPILTGRAILMFGEGGSLTGVTDNFLHSAQLGTWRHLRGQSYEVVGRFFVFNANGSFAGTQETTAEVELSQNGNEYTDTATFELFNASDQVISSGCATATATRFE